MVVEDGTGLPDSDSYVSVEFADDYFAARGNPGWEELDECLKERALVKATDYIDNVFQWYGKKESGSQALRFPRTGIRDYEGEEVVGIPLRLKQAVCDAAALAVSGTELFQTHNENGDVVSENITSLSFTYSQSVKETTGKTLHDSINTRLRGLYKETGRSMVVCGEVERA